MKAFRICLLALCGLAAISCGAKEEAPVVLGDEQFEVYMPLLEGQRVAIFSNQTGLVGGGEEHILDALLAKGVNVTAIFSPEHGFRDLADDAAPMIKHLG